MRRNMLYYPFTLCFLIDPNLIPFILILTELEWILTFGAAFIGLYFWSKWIALPIAQGIGKAFKIRKRLRQWKNNAWKVASYLGTTVEKQIQGPFKIAKHLPRYHKLNSSYSPRYYRHGSVACKKGSTPHLFLAALLVSSSPMFTQAQTPVYIQTQQATSFISLHGDFDSTSCTPDTEPEYKAYKAIDQDYDDYDEVYAQSARRKNRGLQNLCFDSDSFPIGIDSLASACMSPNLEDFIPHTLTDMSSSKKIKPYGKGSSLSIASLGTIRWKIEDDKGKRPPSPFQIQYMSQKAVCDYYPHNTGPEKPQ